MIQLTFKYFYRRKWVVETITGESKSKIVTDFFREAGHIPSIKQLTIQKP